MSDHTRKRPNILRPITNFSAAAIARDQLSTLVLQGISKVPSLSNNLVLKGAGALRQCYFDDARLTNDLDFSATEGYSEIEVPCYEMVEAADFVQSELLKFSPLGAGRIRAERVERSTPPPVPLQTFRFTFERGDPCGQQPRARQVRVQEEQPPFSVSVVVEIALDELIVRHAPLFPLMRPSDECTYVGQVRIYDFEELVAEKLRALLQWKQQVRKGRADMPVANTYFDLWWLNHFAPMPYHVSDFRGLFKSKCLARAVEYVTLEDYFDYGLVSVAMESWAQDQMRDLVTKMPDRTAMLVGASRFIAGWLNLPLAQSPGWVSAFSKNYFG